VNLVEEVATFSLTGLIVSAVYRKLDPYAGVRIPDGQGYQVGGRRTVPR
jgi:hypothetical protein